MPPTVTLQEFQARLGRMGQGMSPVEQALFEWLKAELDDIKARLTAGAL